MKPDFLFVLFTVPLSLQIGSGQHSVGRFGANHGIRKNPPFVGGLICSVTLISIACLLGLQVFLQNKIVYRGLIIVGSFYIMHLTVKLYRLQSQNIEKSLDSMKSESLVIADQNAAVNTFPGLVHTARHTIGVGCIRSG